MKITPDELMDHAFVISVDDNRLAAFMTRWDEYDLHYPFPLCGFTMRVGDYNELSTHIGSKVFNISMSHHTAVKTAEAMDWPYVFILEDDALPCNCINERLEEVLSDIPDDTRVLKLGYATRHPPLPRIASQKFSYGYSIGAHAYIVFKCYYRDYDYIFNRVNAVADKQLVNYDKRTHGPNITVLATNVSLFGQKNPFPGYKEVHDNHTSWMIDLMKKAPGGKDFDW